MHTYTQTHALMHQGKGTGYPNTHSWGALPGSTATLYKCLADTTHQSMLTHTIPTDYLCPCKLDNMTHNQSSEGRPGERRISTGTGQSNKSFIAHGIPRQFEVLGKSHSYLSCGNLTNWFEICFIRKNLLLCVFFELSGRHMCIVSKQRKTRIAYKPNCSQSDLGALLWISTRSVLLKGLTFLLTITADNCRWISIPADAEQIYRFEVFRL